MTNIELTKALDESNRVSDALESRGKSSMVKGLLCVGLGTLSFMAASSYFYQSGRQMGIGKFNKDLNVIYKEIVGKLCKSENQGD